VTLARLSKPERVYGITGDLDGMLTLWMVKTNVTNSSVHQERTP